MIRTIVSLTATALWELEGADHGGAMWIEPNLYGQRVVAWFGGHL